MNGNESTIWTPPFRPETPIGRYGDNIFELIANARSIARQLDWPRAWTDALTRCVMATHSYREACAVLAEHFTLTGEPDEPGNGGPDAGGVRAAPTVAVAASGETSSRS